MMGTARRPPQNAEGGRGPPAHPSGRCGRRASVEEGLRRAVRRGGRNEHAPEPLQAAWQRKGCGGNRDRERMAAAELTVRAEMIAVIGRRCILVMARRIGRPEVGGTDRDVGERRATGKRRGRNRRPHGRRHSEHLKQHHRQIGELPARAHAPPHVELPFANRSQDRAFPGGAKASWFRPTARRNGTA